LFVRLEQGDSTAKTELISKNLRLVAHIVKKYNFPSWEVDDLISIGTVGLIKAIEKFDYSKGSRLVTYAARCVDNEILMYIRYNKKNKSEVYLQEPLGVDTDGSEFCLIDLLGTHGDLVHEEVEKSILIKQVYELMKTVLDNKENVIIQLRYGLSCESKTQREIAEIFGISRSYVSRIETRALKILKKEMEKKVNIRQILL
jgi:RNA polymerase sporulation-specific sigma factor